MRLSARTIGRFADRLRIGAHVAIQGRCGVGPNSSRRYPGRRLSHIKAIVSLEPEPEDPYSCPELEGLRLLLPSEIASLGIRRVSGRVLAVCSGNRFLLQSGEGLYHMVKTSSSELPSPGDIATVAGRPETDLFNINFVHASWRRDGKSADADDRPVDTAIRELLRDESGQPRILADRHGHAIRITGTVVEHRQSALLLRSDEGETVTIDGTSAPASLEALAAGTRVSVAGVCVVDIERWHPNDHLTRIRGLSVVPRSQDDITIIRNAPWWTPLRLLSAIGILLALLAAFIVWNVLLKRAAERRGRELADERVAHVETELKVYERTRLAVELHDALSQNLAGISFEIDAAERLSLVDGQSTQHHLAIASRTLDSCRNELKNCLWDLRNNALEDAEMDTAIRRTLGPVLGEESIAIRFAVPRDRLTDATAHAILCIIRELTVNAIRHGKASRILVAGSFEDGRLMFSVKDNGCGFDPERAPSAQDGHYGLLGIRERVESHEGTFLLESTPGKGCKVTVTLKAPDEE